MQRQASRGDRLVGQPSDRVGHRFGLPEASHVLLTVYDIRGRVVARLVDGHHEAGWYDLAWDGRDGRGKAIATGLYIYRIVAGNFTKTRKMVLIR